MNDQTVPVRLSSTLGELPTHGTAGLRQKDVSRGKKIAWHVVHWVPSSAGRSGSVVNQPSTAGTWVLPATMASSIDVRERPHASPAPQGF